VLVLAHWQYITEINSDIDKEQPKSEEPHVPFATRAHALAVIYKFGFSYRFCRLGKYYKWQLNIFKEQTNSELYLLIIGAGYLYSVPRGM
jgi:hypothetical protein